MNKDDIVVPEGMQLKSISYSEIADSQYRINYVILQEEELTVEYLDIHDKYLFLDCRREKEQRTHYSNPWQCIFDIALLHYRAVKP
jgi:hypothetical protein